MATVSKSHSKLEFCGEPGTVGYTVVCDTSVDATMCKSKIRQYYALRGPAGLTFFLITWILTKKPQNYQEWIHIHRVCPAGHDSAGRISI